MTYTFLAIYPDTQETRVFDVPDLPPDLLDGPAEEAYRLATDWLTKSLRQSGDIGPDEDPLDTFTIGELQRIGYLNGTFASEVRGDFAWHAPVDLLDGVDAA